MYSLTVSDTDAVMDGGGATVTGSPTAAFDSLSLAPESCMYVCMK